MVFVKAFFFSSLPLIKINNHNTKILITQNQLLLHNRYHKPSIEENNILITNTTNIIIKITKKKNQTVSLLNHKIYSKQKKCILFLKIYICKMIIILRNTHTRMLYINCLYILYIHMIE